MLLAGFGDSIMAAQYLPEEDAFLTRLGKRYGLPVLNAGIPGNTSEQGLRRMAKDVLAYHPDLCIIAFGMNDHTAVGPNQAKVPISRYKYYLTEMVRHCKAQHCIPVLCTVQPVIAGNQCQYYYARHPQEWYRHPIGVQAWINEYSRAVREVAAEQDVLIADIAYSFRLARYAGIPLSCLVRTIENSGIDDGVHPNAAGHELYERCIAGVLDLVVCLLKKKHQR